MERWARAIANLLLILTAFAGANPAAATKHAFVVGIGDYPNLGPEKQLERAKSDAAAVAETLKALGYEITTTDRHPGRDDFLDLWIEFLAKIRRGDLVTIYFSGHGVQIDRENYLLPANIRRFLSAEQAAAKNRAIRVADLLGELDRKGPRVSIMILDACRDNPFEDKTKAGGPGAGGLSIERAPIGTVVMYAAGPNQTALEQLPGAGGQKSADTDRYSLFTRKLVPLLRLPGLEIRAMAQQLRDEVETAALAASHHQRPAYEDNLSGRFCFAGCEAGVAVAAAGSPSISSAPSVSEAGWAWARIHQTRSVPLHEAFIEQFPGTLYAAEARERLAELRLATGLAVIQPSPPPAAKASPRCDGIEAQVGSERRCLKPGAGKTDWFKDCATCPDMVVAPAGQFTMGSPGGEPEREPFNKGSEDQVAVTIASPFAVGRFAVTRGEFAAFVAATSHKPDGGCYAYAGAEWKLQADRDWRSAGFTQTDKHPAVCVNWNDAKAYSAWLSSTTGKSYRLLSESEREYVARAGTATPFWWATSISASHANYAAHLTDTSEWRKATVPVESFAANGWGLYNVHGNVWDWTEDCWNENNAGNPADGRARIGGDCGFRVMRGGSWVNIPQFLRTANRGRFLPDNRYVNVGFRLARTLSPP